MVGSTQFPNSTSSTNQAYGSPYAPKGYGTPSAAPYHFKGLGGGSAQSSYSSDVDLAALSDYWKNEVAPYFANGGSAADLDPTVLDSIFWAAQQLHIQFDPSNPASFAADGTGEVAGPQGDEWGGYPGSSGDNLVYDGSDVTVGYDGSTYTHDIWGSDITILSNSKLVDWTMEVSMAGNPAKKVGKCIGHNKENGKDSVYIIHDLEDVNSIKFETPGGKKVSLLGDAATLTNADGDTLVSVEEYKGEASQSGKGGLPVNKDHPEDIVADDEDSATGTLTYNTSGNGEIHADYDDEWTIHEVTGPGPYTIHGASYADTYKVEYNPDTFTWTIYAYKDGDPNVVETFIIHGTEDTQVVIDAMGENQIVNTTPEALDSVVIGTANADGSEGTGGTSGTGGSTSSSEIINNLMAEVGKNNEGQLINALKSAGFQFEDMKDLEKAMKDGTFPPSPSDYKEFQKLVNFLYVYDDDFMDKAGKAKSDITDSDSLRSATERLRDLLQCLYPSENVNLVVEGDQHPAISIGGETYYPIYEQAGDNGGVPILNSDFDI